MAQTTQIKLSALKQAGIEVLPRNQSGTVSLPKGACMEAPTSLKWTKYEHSLELGAFSYHVSGYAFAARVGRYCSFGENVQIGRQNHPMTWASTSPAFYLRQRMFDIGDGFAYATSYHEDKDVAQGPSTQPRITTIGHDVWVGHGAYIAAGVDIGTGAVVAAHSVVVKDVPPYAVVAGNPAVIKKWRIDAMLISPMLKCAWWRFAPWQLKSLDPACPARFVHNVMHLPEDQAYRPSRITVEDSIVSIA